jgi:hypothetical protein
MVAHLHYTRPRTDFEKVQDYLLRRIAYDFTCPTPTRECGCDKDFYIYISNREFLQADASVQFKFVVNHGKVKLLWFNRFGERKTGVFEKNYEADTFQEACYKIVYIVLDCILDTYIDISILARSIADNHIACGMWFEEDSDSEEESDSEN